jgi:RimJ/RimL family protein N-acetyltransferase
MRIVPVTLEGKHVRLEPLTAQHHAALCAVGLDPAIWTWTAGHVETADGMRDYIARALARQESGEALPFATVARREERVVGSTRFGAIERTDRGVEIGWTWIAPPWQRTAINTEAKYLMLRHAFETWRCLRVALMTDVRNEASRRAILRLGAVQEGVLRNHRITSRGHVRDTVAFSITDREWPDVEARLQRLLAVDSRRPR